MTVPTTSSVLCSLRGFARHQLKKEETNRIWNASRVDKSSLHPSPPSFNFQASMCGACSTSSTSTRSLARRTTSIPARDRMGVCVVRKISQDPEDWSRRPQKRLERDGEFSSFLRFFFILPVVVDLTSSSSMPAVQNTHTRASERIEDERHSVFIKQSICERRRPRRRRRHCC